MENEEVKEQTVGEWLKTLANSTVSNERDDAVMQALLRKKFPNAIVKCGIVYFGDKIRPMDIHFVAKLIGGKINIK